MSSGTLWKTVDSKQLVHCIYMIFQCFPTEWLLKKEGVVDSTLESVWRLQTFVLHFWGQPYVPTAHTAFFSLFINDIFKIGSCVPLSPYPYRPMKIFTVNERMNKWMSDFILFSSNKIKNGLWKLSHAPLFSLVLPCEAFQLFLSTSFTSIMRS